MQVVILAGGLATRLNPLTQSQPKSMIRVSGRPFLEYQLEFLKQQSIIDSILLCTGHLQEQIEDYFGDGKRFGIRIKYSHEDRLLGTAGALRNAGHLLDDVFFTLYGDSYLFVDLQDMFSFFKSRNKLALMSVYKNHDKYDRSNTAIDGEMVKKHNKETRSGDMVYIEYGANIFRKEVIQMIPDDRPYSLSELFVQLIEKEELLAYKVAERFYEIGSLSGLRDFEEFAGGKLSPIPASSQTSLLSSNKTGDPR